MLSFCHLRHRLVGPLRACSQCHGDPISVSLWPWPGSEPRTPALALADSCFPFVLGKQVWDEAGISPCFPVFFSHLLLLMALLFFKEFSSMEDAMVKQNLFFTCVSHTLRWHLAFPLLCDFPLPSALLFCWSEAAVVRWFYVSVC